MNVFIDVGPETISYRKGLKKPFRIRKKIILDFNSDKRKAIKHNRIGK